MALVLALSTSLHVLTMTLVFTVPAMAPAISAGLGIDASLVGAQVILVYTAAMLASLRAGTIVMQFGAVRATQLSMLGGTMGLALSAVPSAFVIAVASLVLGASYGLINPSTGQMLEHATNPARRAIAFSIKQSAIPLGGILAGAIAPPLALALGWQGALLAIAAFVALCAAMLGATRPWFPIGAAAGRRGGSHAMGDIDVILKTPVLRYTCLAVAAFAGVQLVLTTYLVTILVHHLELGLPAAGIALSFFNGGGVAGRFWWGFVADTFASGSRVLAVAFGLGVLLLYALPFITAQWPKALVYGFLTALGVAVGGWTGVFVSEVVRLSPAGESARAIAGAYVFTFAGALSGLALFLTGFSLMQSYGATLWLLIAMALVGFVLSLKALGALRPSTAKL